MQKDKFSIIVPCYRQAEFLPEALDSVLAQDYGLWECIIVNDGSPDATAEVAQAYVAQDARFRYLYQENQGVAAARNRAIQASTGEYILPLDADDCIAPTYLSKALAAFHKEPATALVYCGAMAFGVQNGLMHYSEYSYENLLFFGSLHNSCIYTREGYDHTQGYCSTLRGYEDWDFYLSLLQPHDVVYKIEEPLYLYRHHAHSRNTEANRHEEELLVQLYHRHEDIYAPYAEHLIRLQRRLRAEQNHAEEIYRTRAYRLGYRLLHPFVVAKQKWQALWKPHQQ